MEALQRHQSPLFGRFTAQWHLQPMPFAALADFFPNWSVDERVALYAIVGGIPVYLRWLDPERGLTENLRDVMLAPGSMFQAEPDLLLYDELRDLETYHAILRAIAGGEHTVTGIANACLISTASLSSRLQTLQELHFVERRLPVTVPLAQRRRAKRGRYHLQDPFFRFYYRFLWPHLRSLARPEATVAHIRGELRAYVAIAFERLAQEWLLQQSRQGLLPVALDDIGAHWSRRVQVDVVGINWEKRWVIVGECKWGEAPVDRQVARDLVEGKGPLLLRDLPGEGEGWQVQLRCLAAAVSRRQLWRIWSTSEEFWLICSSLTMTSLWSGSAFISGSSACLLLQDWSPACPSMDTLGRI